MSKVRELRIHVAHGMDPEEARIRLRRYRKSLEMLRGALPDSELVDILRSELATFG